MTIGEQLRAARQDAAMTQQAVATAVHVARQTVSNWENGRSYPDIDSLLALSDLYALSLDALLKDSALQDALRQKARARRYAELLYTLTALSATGLMWLGLATVWRLPGMHMDDGVQYGLLAILAVNIVSLAFTGRRHRQLSHVANQLLGHKRLLAGMIAACIACGWLTQTAGLPQWCGLAAVLAVGSGLALYLRREAKR